MESSREQCQAFFIVSFDTVSNESVPPVLCRFVASRWFNGQEGWVVDVDSPHIYGTEEKQQLLLFQKWVECPLEMLRTTDDIVPLYVHCPAQGKKWEKLESLDEAIFCDWAIGVRNIQVAEAEGWVASAAAARPGGS